MRSENQSRGLGRSFQITNVFGGLAVRENVRLAAQSIFDDDISGRDAMFRDKNSFGDVSAHTDEVLDRIGLASHADERVETPAYGDQRRLGIGIVLAVEHEIYTELFVSPRNPTGTLFQLMEYHDTYEERYDPDRSFVGGSSGRGGVAGVRVERVSRAVGATAPADSTP
nr:hypothetical protein [Halococcus agarilyticus]